MPGYAVDHDMPGARTFEARAIIAVLGIAGILGCAVWVVVAQMNSSESCEVVSLEWERIIEIEALMTVREGDWRIPAGGRHIATESRIHHYEQIPVKRIELDECARPVVRTRWVDGDPVFYDWHTYDIDKWMDCRNVRAAGTTLAAVDPAFVLAEGQGPYGVGQERVSGRRERYACRIRRENGKEVDCVLPFDQWTNLEPGRRVKVHLAWFGNSTVLGDK